MSPPGRRDVLKGMAGAAGLWASGCGVANVAEGEGAVGGDDDKSDTAAQRALLSGIDTFVVLSMENRSFDHYLGARKLHEGSISNGLVGTEWNPSAKGERVIVHPIDGYIPDDLPHDWDAVHAQWNNGKLDGFVRAHSGINERMAMSYYDRRDLPVTYALADEFTICDRWFSSVLGPTWPNRLYMHGGTSQGYKGGRESTLLPAQPVFGFTSLFSRLDDAGFSHREYFHDLPWSTTGYYKVTGFSSVETFFEEARDGTLPNYSMIDPRFFGALANDDHPMHDNIGLGQLLISSVYNALAQSPQWSRTLLIVVYDEHGGFFDHVAPPLARGEADPEFQRMGFRVPALLIGPTVKRRGVLRTTLEHSSIPATLSRRFGLEKMNDRVSLANDLAGCFDTKLARGSVRPAPSIPKVEVSEEKLFGERDAPMTHEEMWAIAERGFVPKALDRRRETKIVTRRLIDHAERLGTIKILP